jgi:glycosyltransferase involved in cell wall biosynthesis
MALPEGEATAVVRATGCGLCIPPENPFALAQAVSDLADAPARIEELRARSRAAASGYSREKQSGLMLDAMAGIAIHGR